MTLARSNGAYVGVAKIDVVHEGMNHISNVNVHLKTRSGNVNITRLNTNSPLIMVAITIK